MKKRFKGIILYNGATGGSKDVTNSIVSDNKKKLHKIQCISICNNDLKFLQKRNPANLLHFTRRRRPW